jgi:hypothetical protein
VIKYLIILLFPFSVSGQIVFTNTNSGFSTTGIGSVLGPTLTAGKFYIMFAGTSNGAGTPATVSLSGTGQTWTEIGTAGGALNSTSGKRVQAFRYYATSTTTSDITFSYTGTQDGGWCALYEVAGAVTTGTNGADAIVQTVTNTDNATQHPNISLAALQSRAGVIAGWINDVNPPAGTAEASWTESIDGGYATPDTGGYVMYRSSTSDNTPSWTAGTFSNWAGIGIEVKALSNTGLPLYFFN